MQPSNLENPRKRAIRMLRGLGFGVGEKQGSTAPRTQMDTWHVMWQDSTQIQI